MSTHGLTVPKPVLKPLLGEQHFSMLMKTKPLSRTEAYFLHIRLAASSVVAPLYTQTADNALSVSAVCALDSSLGHAPPVALVVHLGLVVPKKAYALAVDRNRIRRVLRAQCMSEFQRNATALQAVLAAQAEPSDIHCLFRVKTLPKQMKQAKQILRPAVDKTAASKATPQPNAAYINPHSRAFTQSVHTQMAQAVQRLLRESLAAAA
jgi:ribonuclease P protein component